MKIDLDTVKSALLEAKIDKDKINLITRNLEVMAEEEKSEREAEKGPKAKNEFLVVLPIFDETMKPEDYTAYVVTQKENEDAGLLLSRISDAARLFNETKKGKKNPFVSLVDVFGHIKRKFVKDVPGGINIKTKEPVRVIVLRKDSLV